MSSPRRSLFAGLGGLALSLSLVTGADAAQPYQEWFHDDFSVNIGDFCDSPGLDVRLEGTVDGRLQVQPKRQDQLAYFLESLSVHEKFTALPSEDHWVTTTKRFINKDLRVTDNGDGTLTILAFGTGNAVMYDKDGSPIARDPGQLRWQLLVDDGGTPGDPFDDEELDFSIVRDSTGRSDDWCAALVPALTG